MWLPAQRVLRTTATKLVGRITMELFADISQNNMKTEPIQKKHEGHTVTLVAAYKANDAPPRPEPPTMEREITEVIVGNKGPLDFLTKEPSWRGREIRRVCGYWRVVV